MPTTSSIAVTPGTGAKNVASYSVSEDAITKELGRVTLSTSAGVESGTAASPVQVSLANTAANSTAVKVDGSAVTQPVSGTVNSAQSGTWTVQPGNTANSTAWKVDGSAVNQPVVGSAASAATDSGNPVKVGSKYNLAAPTFSDGQRADAQGDVNGNWKVTLATLIAGEDLTNNVLRVENRATYSNISTSTLIKSGAGRLFGWIVNSHSSGTLKLWDNTSAATTIIFNTITFASGPGLWVLPVAVEFATGLYATVGGTADITLLYK